MAMSSQSSPEQRLADLGIALPTPAAPVAAYIPAKRVGNLLYISGQIPFRDGALVATGPVPSSVTLEAAQGAARQCLLNGLAAAQAALGSLERVKSVVRLGVFVQSDPGFVEHPKVANGASELAVQVFGDAGKHVRAAVGCNTLPLNASVEVELLLEVV